MHDISTRAWEIRRQASAMQRGLLAAVLVLAGTPLAAATATQTGEQQHQEQTAGMAPISPAYDASIQIVDRGNEGLQLAARLSEEAEPLQRDILWQVTDAAGNTVISTASAITQGALDPGAYQVQATYGSAVYRRMVELPPGQRLALNFLLNAGAIRVLATVEGLSLDTPSINLIYAASGPDKGKLVTISRTPGEILRLVSGQYRIESRLEPGNAVLVTDVAVRPGIISSLNIAHKAGLLHFNYVGASSAEVRWQVLTLAGQVLLELEGLTATAHLRPGDYRVEMQAVGKIAGQQVELSAGEEKSLTLPR